MEEIVKLAAELGKRIAANERFTALRNAEDAAEKDSETCELLDAANKQRETLAQLEAEGKPIEPEDKREMQRLDDAIRANEKLQALARARADYLELMNRVNEAIRSALA